MSAEMIGFGGRCPRLRCVHVVRSDLADLETAVHGIQMHYCMQKIRVEHPAIAGPIYVIAVASHEHVS